MLLRLTKKICPLVSLALMFGCGKKINDASSSDNGLLVDHNETSNILTLQLNEQKSLFSNYKVPKIAWLSLPDRLLVIEGSAIGKTVKIRYNVQEDGTYEFQCSYHSATEVSEMPIDKCHLYPDSHNVETEIVGSAAELEGMKFRMDLKTTIQMELQTSAPSSLVINSVYQVDWK